MLETVYVVDNFKMFKYLTIVCHQHKKVVTEMILSQIQVILSKSKELLVRTFLLQKRHFK